MDRRSLLLTVLVSSAVLGEPAQDAPLEDPGGRVRFGASAGLGALVPLRTVIIDAEARLGYQASDRFSAFLIGGTSWGVGPTYLVFVGGIVEFTPVHFFYVGGGAVFGYGRVSAFNISDTLMTAFEPDALGVAGAFKPGLDFRFGFSTARKRPVFQEAGFTIGFDARMFFHTDLKLTWSQGARRAPVTTNESIMTITPMVVLGFDSR